jgi:pimeloyl-ACP methyl ester carboxylesterase
MSDAIEPFHLDIPQAELDELRRRLGRTRWPEAETVEDWTQGAPLAKVRQLCEHWRTGYDWRRCEAMLNGFGQYRTVLDGLPIHFLHIRSPEASALPLIMTHGWPGSVIEFHKVIGPLTDPAAHGGRPADAFDLVLPSLPGYGFSGKPAQPGWKVERIAAAWAVLMQRLGYTRWAAQGGDWGAAVTGDIGKQRPSGCVGIHLNVPIVLPTPEEVAAASPEERGYIEQMKYYNDVESGYAKQQATRPQTLGYGLADSPVGQAAWIYEKFFAWTDNAGTPESVLGMDEMLDNIMLYWLPNTGTSSARLYWESAATGFASKTIELPVGVSVYPRELFHASRRWAERRYHNIVHWNELDRGGHFAAFEQPGLFVDELRACFRSLR